MENLKAFSKCKHKTLYKYSKENLSPFCLKREKQATLSALLNSWPFKRFADFAYIEISFMHSLFLPLSIPICHHSSF